jgi:hypothetical protein
MLHHSVPGMGSPGIATGTHGRAGTDAHVVRTLHFQMVQIRSVRILSDFVAEINGDNKVAIMKDTEKKKDVEKKAQELESAGCSSGTRPRKKRSMPARKFENVTIPLKVNIRPTGRDRRSQKEDGRVQRMAGSASARNLLITASAWNATRKWNARIASSTSLK